MYLYPTLKNVSKPTSTKSTSVSPEMVEAKIRGGEWFEISRSFSPHGLCTSWMANGWWTSLRLIFSGSRSCAAFLDETRGYWAQFMKAVESDSRSGLIIWTSSTWSQQNMVDMMMGMWEWWCFGRILVMRSSIERRWTLSYVDWIRQPDRYSKNIYTTYVGVCLRECT